MARPINKLTATGAAALTQKGRHSDGGGLYLLVKPSGSRSWVFRYIRQGVEHELGLGSYPAVSLANARKSAVWHRERLAAGLDPKTERDRERERSRTFGETADEYLEAMSERWSNEKTRWQWKHSLTEIAAPIRKRFVAEVDTPDILKVLKPIWQKTPETAAKTRMRLEAVLDYAKAKGWRSGENPARWRGHLSNILPARQKLTRGHHPAMPYQDVPAFLVRLRDSNALAARGLEFLILTACRSGEVREAVWEEIDFDQKLWTIPAARMKAKRDHRVPLSDCTIEILAPLYKTRISQYVFPGQVRGKPLSIMAFEQLMKRMNIRGASPHGFRSSFRDWAGDRTSFPREIAEAALAHKVGDSTELAYRRGDALEKRRQLMEAWGEYCGGKEDAKVISLHA